ncbi:MAG: response regulator transcription factor [Treponema sp.]|jgi:DNA-binding NarL/FixJ family response regulator|nr:response regulator transcription factor [Treponema sp.]
MIRIIIAAEEEVRKNFSDILRCWPEFEIAGQARDGYDLIRLANAIQPEIALVDEKFPFLDGVELTSALNHRSPNTNVIILTKNPLAPAVLSAINHGAAGYLMKNAQPTQIIAGIKYVHSGGSLISRDVAVKAFSKGSEPRKDGKAKNRIKMTRQELRLMACIGQGFSNKEIAQALKLQNGTIRNYISAILQKTGFRNRTEVAIYAHNMGIVKETKSSLNDRI